MKLKFMYLGMAVLLLLPSVIATEQTAIHTEVDLTFYFTYNSTSYISVITINGENGLLWEETLTNLTFNVSEIGEGVGGYNKTFAINIIREMGNDTDITNIFEILDLCLNQLNYTNELDICRDSNVEIQGKLLDVEEDLGYETNFTKCRAALSSKEAEKDNLDKSWQDKYDDLGRQKTYFLLALLFAGGYTLYDIVVRRKGQLGFRREERTALPKEQAV